MRWDRPKHLCEVNRFYRAQDWRGLEEAGTSLDALDRSRFNIIFSTTQKIILKRQRKENTAMDLLSGATGNTLTPTAVCTCCRPLQFRPARRGRRIDHQSTVRKAMPVGT